MRIRQEDLDRIKGWENVNEDDRESIRAVTELLVGLHKNTAQQEGPENIYIIALEDRYVLIAEFMFMIRMNELITLNMNLGKELGLNRVQEVGYTPSYDLSEYFEDHKGERVHGVIVVISSIAADTVAVATAANGASTSSSPPRKRLKRSRSFIASIPVIGRMFANGDDLESDDDDDEEERPPTADEVMKESDA